MTIANQIISTANALQMDPVDLATIISYETAGTFDPTKKGPTTQWGQHRGLIQFGEPQAQEYGVDWNDPVNSQLGANGAIANYFRKNGWQPGMGLMDAYSIVNAGGPGLHNRSDANNGGAPGTVADKVNNQMSGHRAKAVALLGGEKLSFPASIKPTTQLETPSQPLSFPEGLLGAIEASQTQNAAMQMAATLQGMSQQQPMQTMQRPQMQPLQLRGAQANPYANFFGGLRG